MVLVQEHNYVLAYNNFYLLQLLSHCALMRRNSFRSLALLKHLKLIQGIFHFTATQILQIYSQFFAFFSILQLQRNFFSILQGYLFYSFTALIRYFSILQLQKKGPFTFYSEHIAPPHCSTTHFCVTRGEVFLQQMTHRLQSLGEDRIYVLQRGAHSQPRP